MKPKLIGVLILNTNFPRLHGDIGNPSSFDFPVEYVAVKTAIPANVTIAQEIPQSLQSDFINAAKTLIDKQVSVITTSCGFLSTMQNQLSRLSTTPVICSALALLPILASLHGGATRLGVLTFNRETLNDIHTAGISPGAIEGLLPTDTLRQVISEDQPELNKQEAQRNALAACDRLLASAPHTTAIVLECTNLSPYKTAIRQHTKLPVYDIVDAIHWILNAQM